MRKFIDAAGREAYVDQNGMVFTQGGKNPTYYNVDSWNQRQVKKYGEPKKQTVEEMLSEITKKTAKEEKKYVSEYLKKNPFAFDENLARQSSTAEYDPYYSEILNDYLSDVETKRSSVQDQKKLAEEMYKYDVGAKSREYANAVSQTEEGFAGSGLYFSGAKERALGTQEIENQDATGQAKSQFEYGQTQLGRQETALDTEAQRKERDVGRDKTAAIESGVLQRQGEAQKAYYSPLVSSYYRRFPSSSGGALSGYLPEEYLRY